MLPERTLIFVGPSAAGKDTVIDRISLMTGAEVISTSKQVRKLAQESGLVNPSRNELQKYANSMREQYGEDIFSRLAVDDVEKTTGNKLLLVSGVRNPAEINVFRNPVVIGVDASREVRFQRNIQRSRPSDPKTWEDFLICDDLEKGSIDGEKGQQNLQCLSKADIIINNDSDSIDALEYYIDLFIDQLINQSSLYGIQKFIEIPNYEYLQRKKLIILNGPHGAGKTTIARLLELKFGIPFVSEVGSKLRREVDYNAMESGVDFDREVMRREILRDHLLSRDRDIGGFIVETWHTGNIAYSSERSPEFLQKYIKEFEKQLQRFSVRHFLLNISDSTFLERATENVQEDKKEQLLCFYKKIAEYTRSLYLRYNLEFDEINNNGDIHHTEEIVSRKVVPYISTFE